MTDDPLRRYAASMESEHAPDRLANEVLARIASQRLDESAPAAARPSAFSVKRRRFRGAALAACLALIALVAGAALVVPQIMGAHPSFDFVVKAYGASGDSLASAGGEDRILFEADTLARVPSDARYAEEGVYTGCLLRIEGEDIVRIRAHLDKGELYRYTYDEFLKSSDPERWDEALAWDSSLIGQGERFGAYDLVQPSATNSGPTADGDQLVAVKCFQRLGSTVDLPVRDEDGMRLTDYCLGFWTNEDVGGMGSYQDYIDTLDGATLTLTIEKADGSISTKVIELSSADVKAKKVHKGESETYGLELTGEIVDPLDMSYQDETAARNVGFTWIRTLVGTVVEENRDPFPYGGPSHSAADLPVTKPAVEGAEPAVEPARFDVPEAALEDVAENWTYCRNLLAPGETIDVLFYRNARPAEDGTTQTTAADGTLTCSNLTLHDTLPEGVTREDLAAIGVDEAYFHDTFGFRVGEDGSLTPGFSYATIDVTIANTSDAAFDACPLDGGFGVMRRVGDDQYFASTMPGPLAVAGVDTIDASSQFNRYDQIEPGETKTYTVVHVVSDEEAADPGFAYYYSNTRYRGRMTAAFLLEQAAE